MEIKRHTFDEAKERAEQRGDEWTYGAVAVDLAAIPVAQRLGYLPDGQLQFNNLMDTEGCASRGPLNILETKLDYFYANGMHPALKQWFDDNGYRVDGKFKLCDAFIEILSGTTPTGNSLKAPLEAIRKYGVIPAALIPLKDGMTWEQYMDPARITQAHRDLGQQFLRRLSINYEQVSAAQFVDAINDDLLDVALHAWADPINGVYPAFPGPFNHAIAAITGDIYAFDNYEPFLKRLAKDYQLFDWCYSLSVTSQNPYPDETVALFDVLQRFGLLAFFAEAWKRLFAAPVAPQGDLVPATPGPTPEPTPPHVSRITDWAKAIEANEGAAPASNNPGNLKYTSLTASWGATKGRAAADGGYLCQFPTYQQGFQALCNFLTLGAEDQLLAFHKARTLQAFTVVYAGNPPQPYIDRIGKQLGVSLDIDVSQLL